MRLGIRGLRFGIDLLRLFLVHGLRFRVSGLRFGISRLRFGIRGLLRRLRRGGFRAFYLIAVEHGYKLFVSFNRATVHALAYYSADCGKQSAQYKYGKRGNDKSRHAVFGNGGRGKICNSRANDSRGERAYPHLGNERTLVRFGNAHLLGYEHGRAKVAHTRVFILRLDGGRHSFHSRNSGLRVSDSRLHNRFDCFKSARNKPRDKRNGERDHQNSQTNYQPYVCRQLQGFGE